MSDRSIWKKEVSFRKKATPPTAQPAPVVQPGERPASIWKRELRFRKPIELGGATAPAETAEQPTTVAPVDEAATRFDPAPSWDAPDPQVPFETAAVVEPAHVTLESRAEPDTMPADEAVVAPRPASEPAVEHWLPGASAPAFEPAPAAGLEAGGAAAPDWRAEDEQQPEPEEELYGWTPESPTQAELLPALDEATPESEQAAEPEPRPDVVPTAAWEPETFAEAMQPGPAPPTSWMPLSALDEPGERPEPAAEVHAAAEPTLEPLPEPEATPDAVAAAAALEAVPAAAKPSRLKRELKLPGRKRRAATAAAAVAVADAQTPSEPAVEATPAAPKPSLLKRDLKPPKPGGSKSGSGGGQPRKMQDLVGLRIGSSQLAAAYIHNGLGAELEQLVRAPMPRGIVSSGEVRDPEALTHELKKFFVQHKLPRRGVRLGIASNRIGIRVLDVPKVDDPKLFDNAIRFHAQETLPIAITDAFLDHVVLGETPANGHEATVRVLLVFAHRELVERHVDACRRAGLKLAGVDFEAFALLRAIGGRLPAGEEASEAVVAVAIGHERTIFAVSDGKTCDFTRVLEWGGGTLDIVIGRALNLTPSQAEPIKLALGLDGPTESSHLEPAQIEAVRAAIRTEIQTLARELVASLQFYQSRADSLDIGSIVLSGGGSELLGFPSELERLVGIPVRVGDPLGRVELGRKVGRPAEPGSFAIAIGLGIED